MAAAVLLISIGCQKIEDTPKVYPVLKSLDDTMWYSYDQKNDIYYDIYYNADNKGVMLGYSEQERLNEVVNRPFSYTFTPATEDIDAVVNLRFDDGQMYGGILVPKGNLQISNKDVYIIQLYECDEEGYIIYDGEGKIKSTIMMWRE